MRVYLVRHGETLYNRRNLFQDGAVPLSDLGREQAMETAERLVGCNINFILSSNMLRAKDTAEIIADRVGAHVETTPLLGEIRRPSVLVGKWYFKPRSLWIMSLLLINSYRSKWHYSNEENPCEHYAAAKKVLTSIEGHDEERLIVVTHRVTLTMLLSLMRNGGKVPNFYFFTFVAYLNRIKNASITVCDYDGYKWHIAAYDESKHLQQETA